MAAAAGGQTSKGCVPPGSQHAGEPGQTPLFHLCARKPAAARENRGSAASPGAEPHAACPKGTPRRCWGITVPGRLPPTPGPTLQPVRPRPPLAEPRLPRDVLLAVPAARNSPLLAGVEERKQSCQRRRDSCCSCSRSPPCSRCCRELGSGCPSSSGERLCPPGPGMHPAEEPGPPLPLVSAVAGSWSGTVPGRAVALGEAGLAAAWRAHTPAPQNLLPALPGSRRAGMPQGGGDGGLSPTAGGEGMGDAAETLTDAFRNLKTRRSPLRLRGESPKAGDEGESCGKAAGCRTGAEQARQRGSASGPTAALQPVQLGKLGRALSLLGGREGAGGEREVYWRGRHAPRGEGCDSW